MRNKHTDCTLFIAGNLLSVHFQQIPAGGEVLMLSKL